MKQLLGGAVIFPPGGGVCLAGRAAGKIGGIGNTAVKTAGRNIPGDAPKICAYTFHTALKIIPADILLSGPVGGFRQLNTGNTAARIPGAEQKPQCAAAGT